MRRLQVLKRVKETLREQIARDNLLPNGKVRA